MIFILASLSLITFYTGCMDNIFIEQNNKDLSSLFNNLFPGKEDDEKIITPQKTPLPLEKITITKDMLPLLDQSCAPDEYTKKKIKFITSSLAEKKNLDVITPSMLIFGKPGMGKSTLALSIAYELQQKALKQKNDWTIYRVESTDLATQFQNSGPQNLKAIAEKVLKRKKGTVLICEDMSGFFINFKNDTSDSGANAIAWWQFLDQVNSNPYKHVLVITTDSNTEMPNQLKERLGHTMIDLKTLEWPRTMSYIWHKLKTQPRVHYPCEHAPFKQEKPVKRNAIQSDNLDYWHVTDCEKCKITGIHRCVVCLYNTPDISYRILDRLIQQTIRFSTEKAFEQSKPYTFRFHRFIELVENEFLLRTKKEKNDEYELLKMDQKYESEQELLHKRQIEQQRQFHKEQQGLALLQFKQDYNQKIQQLVFSRVSDGLGLPGGPSIDPKTVLNKEQYELYENVFTKNMPNAVPLYPGGSKEEDTLVENELMILTLEKLKKLSDEQNKN